MNQHYEELLARLGYPQSLVDCMMARIPHPLVAFNSPPHWYGCLPALIPIWDIGSGPTYLGLLKHWFTDRPPTFVRMYLDLGTIIEIARTPEQFFAYAVIAAIVGQDGVQPATERFAAALGVTNLTEIDNATLNTGDDPKGFSAISQFRDALPLACITASNQYDGAFPTGNFDSTSQWWLDACSFEISRETEAAWPTSVPKPEWLVPGKKVDVFDKFLVQGDFHAAWLTLNSTGWSTVEAVDAIQRLANKANDSVFTLLTSAWTNFANGRGGNY
jgi:hypothetical protein